MQATSTNFKTTIAGNDVTTNVKVTIALPGSYTDMTLAVESIDVDRELATDLPDGTKSVTGHLSAGGTVVLSGLVDQTDVTKNAAWLFNPYSTDSPLYRLDPTGSVIVVSAGVANKSPDELVPLLTGVVSKVTVDMQAGTVSIECVDNRGKMRTAPAFPGIGATMLQQPAPPGDPLNTLLPGLTGLWPLDFLLRANGIYASTSPRPGCGFYASMCGGAYPQILGNRFPPQVSLSNEYVDEPVVGVGAMQFAAGLWTPQVCRDSAHDVALAEPVILNGTGNGWHCEFGLNGVLPPVSEFGGTYPPIVVELAFVDGFVVTAPNFSFFSLTPVSGTTWAFRANDTTDHNVTISAAPHVVDVQANGAVFTLWVDGVHLGQWTSANTPGSVTANDVETLVPYPVEALQVTNETAGVPRTIAAPTAEFDASLNMLIATVDPGTSDAWQIIQQLAEAESGIAGFDETGLFTFTNRQSIATGTSVRTITSAASLKTLQTEQDTARLATHVTLPINALQLGAWGAVWAGTGNRVSNNIYYLPPHTTDTLLATWTDPAVIGPVAGVGLAGGISATRPLSGYRAARAADGSGGEITNLQVTIVQTSPVNATVTITNPNNFNAYFATPPGYPTTQGTPSTMALAGATWTAAAAAPDAANDSPAQLLADSQWPPAAEGGAPANPRGEIILALPANPWVQDPTSAQARTDDLLGELCVVKPQWTNVTIVADPSLQLTDHVTVSDPDATQISEDAILAAIHTTISETDWTQDIDMRAAALPGRLLLGVTGRSELGVNAYV